MMDDLQQDEALSSRTGKLWIEYMQMVTTPFIRAERSGDWDLHLYCIAKTYCLCKVIQTLPGSNESVKDKNEYRKMYKVHITRILYHS